MIRDEARRPALASLLAGMLAWCAGAMVIVASGANGIPDFPLAAKVLMIAAYTAFTGFVVLDVGNSEASATGSWLDALVMCGGTGCLASSVVLLPVSSHDVGTAVLSLVIPLFDVVLAVLVLAQIGLGVRLDRLSAFKLAGGFVLLASADAQFVANLSSGVQNLVLVTAAARLVGFGLIIEEASRPRELRRTDQARISVLGVAASAAIAIFVLAARPAGGLGGYLSIPAVLTLLGAAGRLVASLRESRCTLAALARSHTDELTRLPNRRGFTERLDASLAAGTDVALMVLDLDGFKDINDTLGHAAGDVVLKTVACRIREAVPASVSLARLSGDEFGILLPRSDAVHTIDAAQHVLDVLNHQVVVDGLEVALSASVGLIERCQEAKADSNELIRRAQVAMYRAKQKRSGIACYDPFHDEYSKAKLRISEELRRGIENDELEVWYQPQIDASTMQPCAMEALVRWRHPKDGLLPPIAFLSAARRTGLMPLLSQQVIRKAITDLSNWRALGFPVRLSLNCAPPELLSGVFLPRLHRALEDAGLTGDAVAVEVTEESFLGEPDRAREILAVARSRDIEISIDDYGTGFSSLAYLRDLPVDELKLDRSFVSQIATDHRSRMIVASTLQMARALGMRTVAEGVEDAAAAADLIAMGVDRLQGYH
ncbi:MAG TPA: bifunctional diguanylate cyclase/phosphodiesterase, partial [Jatrophihabitans sp.]|nr:bifunctional diguanylate cyclase/phosphodiesterase [Jatrophihabitans sp.]